MSDNISQLVESLSNLKVTEIAELAKQLEDKWGVSASSVVMSGNVASSDQPSGEAQNEKTHFDVNIKEVGGKKIQIVKIVKDVTGLGLGEAKKLVDSAPGALIKSGVEKAEAEEIKKRLETEGAVVELS